MTLLRWCFVLCACWCTFSWAEAAPPNLTFLFPAGAQQGKTVEVVAGGTFERWPVPAWASAKGLAITPAKDKGKLTIVVAADAAPGTHWIRIADEQGASALRPFLVGTLPEVLEVEPNDDFKKPQILAEARVLVNGRLEKAGDVDCFAVPLTKGQTLVASLEANRTLKSPMDGHLQIVSSAGFVLAENNDDHGLDPQIVFVAPAEGRYVIRTFAFPAVANSSIAFAGGPNFIYRLTLTTGGFVDHSWPLAIARANPGEVRLLGWNIPDTTRVTVAAAADDDMVTLFHPQVANTAHLRLEAHATTTEIEPNDLKKPQIVELPITITGRIEPAGDVDVFAFQAKKGQRVTFQIEARGLGSPLDPLLRLTDASGKVLAQADDTPNAGERTRDAELAFTAAQDGQYQIAVRDLHRDGGFRYVYRLRATLAEPDFSMTLTTDRFTLTPGKPLDIPVTIEKRNGLKTDVTLTALDLPPGITAEPLIAKSAGKVTAALRLNATPDATSGAFRLVGAAPSDLRRLGHANVADLGLATPHFWIHVDKKK